MATCRGAYFGAPVADDYVYLYWLKFHRPFDLFDSMGAPLYWRPLTRQVYYGVVQSLLLSHPWLVAALHAALFLAIYLIIYRVARRILSPSLAAAAAAFPIFSEPARALLVWPTQIQYLLPMLTAALAIHEVVEGRIVSASLAGLATLLAHEWGVLVVAALPIVAWVRTPRLARALRWVVAAIAVIAVWGIGHAIASMHGAVFIGPLPDEGLGPRMPFSALPSVLWRALVSQLNLEDVPSSIGSILLAAYGLITAAAVVLAFRKSAARRLHRASGPLLGGVLWWILGVAPLALIVAGWNDWRTTLPGLWLGLSIIGFLGLVHPWFAGGFVLVRVIALLACPVAKPEVTYDAPTTTSTIAYRIVARQQRVVESTRRRLVERYPRLPPGATIGYWNRVSMVEIAFYEQQAPRVWYDDSTLTWRWLWARGVLEADVDAAIGFNVGTRDPAVIFDPRALKLAQLATRAYADSGLPQGDSLAAEALGNQPEPFKGLSLWVAQLQAKSALYQGQLDRADSINRIAVARWGETAESYALSAALALQAGDRTLAARYVQLGLALDPSNQFVRSLARELTPLHSTFASPARDVPRP